MWPSDMGEEKERSMTVGVTLSSALGKWVNFWTNISVVCCLVTQSLLTLV